MSKNKSLKGYVFGALVALVSTTFSVAPAMADANGPVTLLPTQGTTYNTIIGSPISLQSAQDPSTFVTDASEAATSSFYVIDNPNGASISITLAANQSTSDDADFIVYDADGLGIPETNTTASVLVTTYSAGVQFDTNRTKIAVMAGIAGNTLQSVSIDAIEPATGAVTVPLTVQTIVDQSLTKLGVADGFDRVSAKQAVVLYALGDVSAVTTITALTPGQAQSFSATVVYGSSVNPYFVAAQTSVALFVGGTNVPINDNFDTNTTPDRVTTSITATADNNIAKDTITAGVTTAGVFQPVLVSTATFSPGIYSAQAYFGNNTAGATSMAWDGTAGASTTLTSVKPSVDSTTDVLFDSEATAAETEVLVKTGTKTLTVNAQLISGSASLAASNIEVKAEISEVSLDATTTITSTGTIASLETDGSKLIAYARTSDLGKASFTITSTTGKEDDALSVVLFAKKSDGTWSVMDDITGGSEADVDVVWEEIGRASCRERVLLPV